MREEMVMSNGSNEGREKVGHAMTLDDKGSVASRWPGITWCSGPEARWEEVILTRGRVLVLCGYTMRPCDAPSAALPVTERETDRQTERRDKMLRGADVTNAAGLSSPFGPFSLNPEPHITHGHVDLIPCISTSYSSSRWQPRDDDMTLQV